MSRVASRVVVVLTGADHWTLSDGSKQPTGFWAETLVAPFEALTLAGRDVVLATPGGVTPNVDQVSLAPAAVGGVEKAHGLATYLAALGDRLLVPEPLEDLAVDDVGALVVAGGHGAMEDLSAHHRLGRLLVDVLDAGRLVAAVAHGTAALLTAFRDDGAWAFAGARMTCFSDEEERVGGLAPMAPWLLESRLREYGGRVDVGRPWVPHVIQDGPLVTAQNWGSSEAFAATVRDWLATKDR